MSQTSLCGFLNFNIRNNLFIDVPLDKLIPFSWCAFVDLVCPLMQLLKLLLDVSVIVKKFLRRSFCFVFFSFSFSILLALNPHCLVQNDFDAVGIMLHVPHITLFFEVQCIHCIIKMCERLKQIKEAHVE